MALTDAKIRAARAGKAILKLSDGGGLQLHVLSSGTKVWRYAYRFGGKQKGIGFGSYPETSLAEARRRHLEARQLLADGVDPAGAKQAAKAARADVKANTFAVFANELTEKKQRENRAERTMEKVRWLLTIATPALGARPITEITAGEILAVLRPMERAGKLETARRVRSLIGEVFRLAIALDVAQTDPTLALRGAIVTPTVTHRPAITDPDRLGELLRAVDGFTGQPQTKAAIQLAALLVLRPGEIRLSKWTDIDLEAGVWRIDAGRAKMRREHRTPLPRQAIEILQALKRITGHGRDNLVFPSARSVRIPISENTMNAALRRLGFDQTEMVSHGFRSTFSSLANEAGLWNPDAIERQLAHVDKNAVRRAYARADFFEERTRMLAWWAGELDRFRRLPPKNSAQ